MRKWIIVSVAVTALALGYLFSPFVSLYRLGQAVRSGDVAAIEARVDMTSLRRSLIRQVLDEGTRGTQLDARLGESGRQLAIGVATDLLDGRAAQLLTPDVLRRLLAGGELPAELAKVGDTGGIGTFGLPSNPLRYVKDYELRSLDRVRITLGGEADHGDWIILTLRLRNFEWRLREVTLPPSVQDRIRPAIRERIDAARF